MAAFLIDRQQSVKIGDTMSNIGYANGGVPQGSLSGPKNFLVQINDLQTPCPIFKYVDDSTVFDVSNNTSVPMLQESADVITDWSRRNDMRINLLLNLRSPRDCPSSGSSSVRACTC